MHPEIITEIDFVLNNLDPFPQRAVSQKTCVKYITEAFIDKGWQNEARADFPSKSKN